MGLSIGTGLAIIAAFVSCVWLVRQPPHFLQKIVTMGRRIAKRVWNSLLLPTLKITFSFVQMVSVMPSLFQVSLPPGYQSLWDRLNSLDLNWMSLWAHEACFGDFEQRLVLTSLIPLALALAAVAGCVAWSVIKQARVNSAMNWTGDLVPAAKAGVLQALPSILLLSFLLVPVVSKKIFSSFDCVSYEFDSAADEVKSILRDDTSVGERPTTIPTASLTTCSYRFAADFAPCGQLSRLQHSHSAQYATSLRHINASLYLQ